jgi:hypothetical protein
MKEKDSLEHIDIDGLIKLKFILKEQGMRLFWDKLKRVTVSWGHGN